MAKLLRRTHPLLCLHAKYATSSRSHYETLEIKSDATHTQIKSAYYKLTLQYHPDKNATAEAKKKFQEISAAYEILGNYSSRQAYDRRLGITTAKTRSEETMTRYKREPLRTSHAINGTIYNFDEWNRLHYTEGFEAYAKYKRARDKATELRNTGNVYSADDDPQLYQMMGTIAFAIMCLTVYLIMQDTESNDVPRKPT